MCGIAGIINLNKESIRHGNVLQRMLKRIHHRGPDGEGIYDGNFYSIGHKRLAIIDIAHGQQPMLSEDKRYSLTFNGEIYNYLEIRAKLEQQGIIFQTVSDTEVLLKLLILKGKEAITQLNGMFAFAFFDNKEKTFILARDQFGIKPLYYANLNNYLIFASEIKALLEYPELKASCNQHALQQYLTFQLTLHGETLFQHIKELEPGKIIFGKNSELAPETYWCLHYDINEEENEKDSQEKLLYLLNDSAKLQVRSDVPLGAYLSGGIDSSLIATLASKQLQKPLPTFTGKFSVNGFNESCYAKIAAKNIDAQLYEIEPTVQDFITSLPKLIYALDQPAAGPGVFPQYFVSQLASKHVKVVLGGQGGDEIFGGYARYLVAYLEQALKGAIFETQEEGNHLVTLSSIIPNLPILQQYKPLMQKFWCKGLFENMDARYFHLLDRSPHLEQFLTDDIKKQMNRDEIFDDFQRIFNHSETHSYINKMTFFDIKTLLPALLQVEDRMSMAASIEARVPLLDTRIVDLLTSIPPPVKFQGGKTKSILKKAAANLLPAEILNRKDKMGFPVPLQLWWQKSQKLRNFIKSILLSKASLHRGLFQPQALESLCHGQQFGRELWGIVCIELWHQIYIDKSWKEFN